MTDQPSLYTSWLEAKATVAAEDAAAAQAPDEYEPLNPRHDGWTADRQRQFLSATADGWTVEHACRLVGMTTSSVYALRQRASGAAFALGWRAARLLARERLADEMMTRALDGVTDTCTRADGSVVTRHRHDNRAALTMLARLDRQVESAPADPAAAADAHAARLVAQDFEAYLDLVGRDAGPARAGLFLARRADLVEQPPALEPVLALARADRFVRTGAALPAEVDVADLDLAARAGWTAEQWTRAEAAGLLRVAPPQPVDGDEPGEQPPLPPLRPDADATEDEPVWWDEHAEDYRTNLPVPAGETARFECGDEDDVDYQRSLTPSERAVVDRIDDLERERRHAAGRAAHARWLAALTAHIAAAEQAATPDGAGEGPAPAAPAAPDPRAERAAPQPAPADEQGWPTMPDPLPQDRSDDGDMPDRLVPLQTHALDFRSVQAAIAALAAQEDAPGVRSAIGAPVPSGAGRPGVPRALAG